MSGPSWPPFGSGLNRISLKQHILTSLSALPNTGKLHLVALSSNPKRTTSLFPHTPVPPRCFQQDFFVVLGTEVQVDGGASLKGEAENASAAGSGRTAAEDGRVAHAAGTDSEGRGHPGAGSGSAVPADHGGRRAVGSEANSAAIDSKRLVLTSAISAHLYILPNSDESILYISKVDSSSYPSYPTTSAGSGAGAASSLSTPKTTLASGTAEQTGVNTSPPLPLTRTLITAFISYFLLPATRPTPAVRVQLFARSQGQYLFPNSASGKKGLGGGRLCGWWKGVYEDVVRVLLPDEGQGRGGAAATSTSGAIASVGAEGTPLVDPTSSESNHSRSFSLSPSDIRLAYLLPSYSAAEAAGMMGLPRRPLPEGVEWAYEPPFTHAIPGIAHSNENNSKSISLGDIIPSLEDDPKTRFLDEIAMDTTLSEKGYAFGAPGRDWRRTMSGTWQRSPQLKQASEVGTAGDAPDGAVPDSMDTASQALLVDSSHSPTSSAPRPPSPPPSANGTGDLQSSHLVETPASTIAVPTAGKNTIKARSAVDEEKLRRQAHASLTLVSQSDFWERMGYRGECALDVTGFFTLQVSGAKSIQRHKHKDDDAGSHIDSTTAQKGQLPPAIVERIHKALLNTDFANLQLAIEGSLDWMSSTRTLIQGEIGEEASETCFGEVRAKDPAAVAATQAKREREVENVTVLQPRKKKRA